VFEVSSDIYFVIYNLYYVDQNNNLGAPQDLYTGTERVVIILKTTATILITHDYQILYVAIPD
jgi:hypothetical protein